MRRCDALAKNSKQNVGRGRAPRAHWHRHLGPEFVHPFVRAARARTMSPSLNLHGAMPRSLLVAERGEPGVAFGLGLEAGLL
jgi:hypothetical protein